MLRRKTGQSSSLERNALCGAGSVEEITALRTSTNAIEFSGLFSHTKQKLQDMGKAAKKHVPRQRVEKT